MKNLLLMRACLTVCTLYDDASNPARHPSPSKTIGLATSFWLQGSARTQYLRSCDNDVAATACRSWRSHTRVRTEEPQPLPSNENLGARSSLLSRPTLPLIQLTFQARREFLRCAGTWLPALVRHCRCVLAPQARVLECLVPEPTRHHAYRLRQHCRPPPLHLHTF